MGTRYTVFVDDNYHAGDESERYKLGEFDDHSSAVAACRRIVDEFLARAATGVSAEELLRGYKTYGEDPWITPEGPGARFSAWTYAEQRCRELAGDVRRDRDAAGGGSSG